MSQQPNFENVTVVDITEAPRTKIVSVRFSDDNVLHFVFHYSLERVIARVGRLTIATAGFYSRILLELSLNSLVYDTPTINSNFGGFTQQEIAKYWQLASEYLKDYVTRDVSIDPDLLARFRIIITDGQKYVPLLESGEVRANGI